MKTKNKTDLPILSPEQKHELLGRIENEKIRKLLKKEIAALPVFKTVSPCFTGILSTLFWKGTKAVHNICSYKCKTGHSVLHLCEIHLRLAEKIDAFTFCEDSWIRSIMCSNKLKKIERKAFYRSVLQKIVLPDSIQDIGEDAFAECPKLHLYCSQKTYDRLQKQGILQKAGFCGTIVITDKSHPSVLKKQPPIYYGGLGR